MPVRGKDASLEATRATVTLQPGEVVCWSIYPILGTGEGRYNLMADSRDYPGKYILLGDTERYVGIGTPEKEKVWLKDIL